MGGLALKFLWDKTIVGNPTVSAATYVSPLYDRKVKLDMPVQYIGTAGAAADIGKNAIWVLSIASTATVTWQNQHQVTFTDN